MTTETSLSQREKVFTGILKALCMNGRAERVHRTRLSQVGITDAKSSIKLLRFIKERGHVALPRLQQLESALAEGEDGNTVYQDLTITELAQEFNFELVNILINRAELSEKLTQRTLASLGISDEPAFMDLLEYLEERNEVSLGSLDASSVPLEKLTVGHVAQAYKKAAAERIDDVL